MKVGITLPQFRSDPAAAISVAVAADDAGIEGVFVFDHLWAIGQPDRPALNCWPLLGALAAETERVVLATLVARVSLLPDAMLAHNVATIARIAGVDRVIAGLGVGDRLSEPENEAYGIRFPPLDERVARLVDCVHRVRDVGVTPWVGGVSNTIREVAVAEGVTLNLWDVDVDRVAADVAAGLDVTWGGVVEPAGLDATLRALRDAGASWAVCGFPYRADTDLAAAVDLVATAASAAR